MRCHGYMVPLTVGFSSQLLPLILCPTSRIDLFELQSGDLSVYWKLFAVSPVIFFLFDKRQPNYLELQVFLVRGHVLSDY